MGLKNLCLAVSLLAEHRQVAQLRARRLHIGYIRNYYNSLRHLPPVLPPYRRQIFALAADLCAEHGRRSTIENWARP